MLARINKNRKSLKVQKMYQPKLAQPTPQKLPMAIPFDGAGESTKPDHIKIEIRQPIKYENLPKPEHKVVPTSTAAWYFCLFTCKKTFFG